MEERTGSIGDEAGGVTALVIGRLRAVRRGWGPSGIRPAVDRPRILGRAKQAARRQREISHVYSAGRLLRSGKMSCFAHPIKGSLANPEIVTYLAATITKSIGVLWRVYHDNPVACGVSSRLRTMLA